MNSKLRPEAPVYLPPTRDTAILSRSLENSPILQYKPKEPQCSRYSRRSVRHNLSFPNSPRPILGTKMSYLRAILGRKDENCQSNEDFFEIKEKNSNEEEYVEMQKDID
ncbi:hypothetical protein HHI36_010711 [Cryptolaemus montrouzieri]|uniref:Uncharacterized protein n=1 Tax=Cryptolaemus montrouzieri TaxID=559131 RepID=A0ABD2MJL5_9CUCU